MKASKVSLDHGYYEWKNDILEEIQFRISANLFFLLNEDKREYAASKILKNFNDSFADDRLCYKYGMDAEEMSLLAVTRYSLHYLTMRAAKEASDEIIGGEDGLLFLRADDKLRKLKAEYSQHEGDNQ